MTTHDSSDWHHNEKAYGRTREGRDFAELFLEFLTDIESCPEKLELKVDQRRWVLQKQQPPLAKTLEDHEADVLAVQRTQREESQNCILRSRS